MPSKNKFYIGVTLLIQAVSFFAMSIMLCRKKKSLANAISALAVIGAAAGAWLLYRDAKDEVKRRKVLAARDACCGDDSDGFSMLDDEDDVVKF